MQDFLTAAIGFVAGYGLQRFLAGRPRIDFARRRRVDPWLSKLLYALAARIRR